DFARVHGRAGSYQIAGEPLLSDLRRCGKSGVAASKKPLASRSLGTARAPPVSAMNQPRSFGPYTLLRRLAVGGMAEIYVASTRGLGGFEKLAAIKLVHPHLAADPQFVRMLVEEAKILVLLTHANIAQVFDLGCIEDTYYIAMEFVDGLDVHGLQTVSQRLQQPLQIARSEERT